MKVIDVYERYFEADCVYGGVKRRAAKVTLTATSDEGNITYEAGASFFPHIDPDDFAVSYDAYVSKILYQAKGRRSKKRDEAILEGLRDAVDEVSDGIGAKVFWDKPLGEARRG